MGCEQVLTFEDIEQSDKNPNISDNTLKTNNLLIRAYTGILSPEAKFTDTIIKSNGELSEKLSNFIPSQIKTENNQYTYNLNDDILTKSARVDFDNEYIIAINGINKVIRVEEDNGSYVIFHDNQPKEKNSYIALVVRRISGFNPRFTFASPKRPFL